MAQVVNRNEGLDTLKKYYVNTPYTYTVDQIEEIYDHVMAQSGGPETIKALQQMPQLDRNISFAFAGAFKKSVRASAGILNLWLYSKVTLTINDIPGVSRAETESWGLLTGLPGNFATGTFYYNDESDLHGSDITTQVGGGTLYFELTYWRGSYCFATFQAASFPTVGAMKGSTTFS